MASFSLSYSYKTGDTVEIWGHSQGVTYDDWQANPSIDPYFRHEKFTVTSQTSGTTVSTTFNYDTERGYVAAIYVNNVQVAYKNIDEVIIQPEFSITTYTNSATVHIKNLKLGNSASFTVGSTTKSISSANGSEVQLTVDGLSSNTTYSYSVKVNGTTISTSNATLTTKRLSPKASFSASGRSAYATISQVYPGDKVILTAKYATGSANQGSTISSVEGTVSSGKTSIDLEISNLPYETNYYLEAKVVNSTIVSTGTYSTPSYPTADISASGISVSATISNAYPGDNFTLTVCYGTGHPQQGSEVTYTSGSVQSGQTSLTLKIDNLSYSTNYYATVTFDNGKQIGNVKYFTTSSITRPTLKEVKTGDRWISSTLTNVEANHSVGLWVKYANTNTSAGYQTYSGPVDEVTLSVNNLEYGVLYQYSVTDTFKNEDPSYYYIEKQELWFYPTPNVNVDIGYNSAYFQTSNGYANKIVATILKGSSIVDEFDGSISNFNITNLTPGTFYSYSILFYRDYGDPYRYTGNFTTKTIPKIDSSKVNQTNRSVTVTLSDIAVSDTVTLTIKKASNKEIVKQSSYTRNSSSNNNYCTLEISNLDYGIDYIYIVSYNGGNLTDEISFYFAPPPSFTITKVSFYSVDVKVNNVPSGAIIRANARNVGTNTADRNYQGEDTEFTISGLTPNTSYLLEVFISDTPLENEPFITLSIPVVSNFSTNQNTKTASIDVSNIISIGDTVTFKIEKVTGTNTYQSAGSNSYTRTSNNNSYTTLTVSGLEYDVNYVYTVSHHTGQNLVNAFRRPFLIESPIKPSYTLERGYTKVTINIKDVKKGDNITAVVVDGFGDEYRGSVQDTTTTTPTIVINGLLYDFPHTITVYINGDKCEDGPDNFDTLRPKESVNSDEGVKNVIFIVSNIDKGIKVELKMTGGNININETYTSNSDGSQKKWDIDVEWETNYTYSVSVIYPNGETIVLGSDTFRIMAPTYSISNITTNSAVINVFDIKAKYDVIVSVGTNTETKNLTNNGDISFTFNDLSVGTEYPVEVSIGGYSVSGKDLFYTLFDWWISIIEQGAQMPIWTDEENQKTYPAPVKAVEWNRLVDLINKKKSKSISLVSAGQEMKASNGGNIRQVADALGVSVESKKRITAQFFLDLKTAINNILN